MGLRARPQTWAHLKWARPYRTTDRGSSMRGVRWVVQDRRPWLLIASALGVSLAISPRAQAPSSQADLPGSTFQTEVSYIEVDAVVTDAQGRFVSGLKREDFELAEDSKPQKIDAFSTVEI